MCCPSGMRVSLIYLLLQSLPVLRQYLAGIVFGGSSDMAIWRIINMLTSNTGIYKDGIFYLTATK